MIRKVSPIDDTLYCSPEAGFSVLPATAHELCLHMINKDGHILYTVGRNR